MKNFSIIFPTRSRVSQLIFCLNSILRNSFLPDYIEVLVGYDYDDADTCKIVEIFEDIFSNINLKMYGFERIWNIHAYFNELYKYSCGKTIVTINDDVEFKTRDWDRIAQRKIDDYLIEHKHGLYYGYVTDLLVGNRHGKYSCFPMISRQVVEVLGCLQDERFMGGGADIFLGNIMHDVDNVIDMRDITIDHISYHNYPDMPRDEVSLSMKKKFSECPYERPLEQKSTIEFNEEVDKLRAYKNGFK